MSLIKSELMRCRELEKSEAGKVLAGLVDEVRVLQDSLTRASAFLAAYDVQRGQREITAIEQLIRGTKARLLPKKDFTFERSRAQQVLAADVLSDGGVQVAFRAAPEDTAFQTNQTVELKDLKSNFGNVERYRDSSIVIASDSLFALKLSRLSGCRLVAGPVRGSVFVQDCQNCDIFVCATQLRIHNCNGVRFHVLVQSDPIIEDCCDLVFSPDYECRPFPVPTVENRWKHVRDFNCPIAGSSRNFVLKE